MSFCDWLTVLWKCIFPIITIINKTETIKKSNTNLFLFNITWFTDFSLHYAANGIKIEKSDIVMLCKNVMKCKKIVTFLPA